MSLVIGEGITIGPGITITGDINPPSIAYYFITEPLSGGDFLTDQNGNDFIKEY